MAVVLLGGLLLAAHQSRFDYFFTDDGFISLRYSQRLLEGHGLTFTTGERVEGYSNLLWVLLVAVLGGMGFDLLFAARLLGFLCALATLSALPALVRPRLVREGLAPLLGVGVLVSSGWFVVWSIGGLEVPLVTALLSWALRFAWGDGTKRSVRLSALLLGLLCLCRPDAPLLAVLTMLSTLVVRGRAGVRPMLGMAVGIAIAVIGQLCFRWLYYQDVLPNTAYAKVAFGAARVREGIEHLSESLLPLAGVWLVLVLVLLRVLLSRSLGRKGLCLVLLALSWASYVAFVGGDTFPAWRQLGYVVLFGAMGAAWLLEDSLRRSAALVPSVYFSLCLVVLGLVGTINDEGNWAKRERWQWDGRPVGLALRSAFGDAQPLIAVDAAGTIPYYSELPTLDMLGLTDRYLAHHPPKDIAERVMGHGLGDADYYLRRRPDVFCFGIPPCRFGAKFRAQKEMVSRAEFQDNYTRATISFDEKGQKGQQLESELWIRREGRVGVRRSEREVIVPALLFSEPNAPARLDRGKFRVTARERESLLFRGLDLGPGDWKMSLVGVSGQGGIVVRNSAGRRVRGSSEEVFSVHLSEAGKLDVRVAARKGFSFLGVRFEQRRAQTDD